MKILITGGCGFTGHHFIEHFLKKTNWEIATIDKLSYAAMGFDRVRDIEAYDDKRVQFFTADLCEEIPEGILKELIDVGIILHLAAETHVDNSIEDPIPFVKSNVLGTAHLLQFARKLPHLGALCYFSTDEIFGPADIDTVPDGYAEWDRYNSTNPYSASKAGGEELALAWANTYNLPMFITHTMNMFGERQHPEKFIPLCMRKIYRDEVITIHANKDKTQAGTRFYIHARNVAQAVHWLLGTHTQREKYNIVGEEEVSNLALAQTIFDIMNGLGIINRRTMKYNMVDFHSSRPGHDLRYALSMEKMNGMGWEIPNSFIESLERTVEWSFREENRKWSFG